MLLPWLVLLLGQCFLCFGGWFSNSNWNLGQNRGIVNTSGTNCNDAEGDVDLLQALNVSTALRGVGQYHGPKPLDELPAWKLHATFDHVQLPPGPTANLLHAVQKSHNFVMHFAFRQHRKTIATLLAVNSPGKLSPWLRLTSNLKQGHLMLFYRIKEDTRLHEKIFPLPRHTNWTLLELSIHGDGVTLSLECQKVRKQRLAGHINLHFPKDSLVYFRQEPGFKKKLLVRVIMCCNGLPYILSPVVHFVTCHFTIIGWTHSILPIHFVTLYLLLYFCHTHFITLYSSQHVEDHESFLEYFENTWVGRAHRSPHFPIEMRISKEVSESMLPRTSSSVESWYHVFQSALGCWHFQAFGL